MSRDVDDAPDTGLGEPTDVLWADDDGPAPAGGGRPVASRLLGPAFGVVALGYLAVGVQAVLTVTGDLLSWGWATAWNLPGSTPVDGRGELRSDVLGLTVRGVCVAGIGVVLGLWSRRRVAVAVFGGAAVVALVVGLTTYALAAEDEPDRPEWEDRPRVCQEHSGGDTRCPGG